MITLRGITWDHPRGFQPLAASIKPYAELTGVQISWAVRSLREFGDQPIDKLAEIYDLLIVDHPHVGLAHATGCLVPLDEHIAPDILDALAEQSAGPSHQSYFYKGHQWVLANDAAMQAGAYRADLLNEPFPTTWDEVIALGNQVKKGERWIGIPLVPTDCICCFLTLCSSLGDAPGRTDQLLTDDAVGRHALELLKAFAAVSHPQSLSWNPIKMLDHMSSSDDMVYCPLTFTYTNYSRDGYKPKRVSFTNVPGIRGSILGGAGYAISSKCQHIKQAVDYGVWLCSADIQRTLYVEEGGQPGNGVAWHDDHANEVTHNFFRDTWDTLVNAYVRPRHNNYHIFQEKSGQVIHKMLRDNSSVDACLITLKSLYTQNQ